MSTNTQQSNFKHLAMKAFNSTPSMDTVELTIDKLLEGKSPSTRIEKWYTIFCNANVLGKKFNNAPQIRGRAGEKIVTATCDVIISNLKNANVRGFHSFHFAGTEQDYLLCTPWAFYFIEIKSMLKTTKGHASEISSGATGQNAMHMERFETWAKEYLDRGQSRSIVAIPVIVIINKKENSVEASIKSDHLVCHVTDLLDKLTLNIEKSAKSKRIYQYNDIVKRITDYYYSSDHKRSVSKKKASGGYV